MRFLRFETVSVKDVEVCVPVWRMFLSYGTREGEVDALNHFCGEYEPLLLCERKEGKYLLVGGFEAFAGASRAGKPAVGAVVVEGEEVESFAVAVFNLPNRVSLPLVEKAVLLEYAASGGATRDELLGVFCILLDVPPREDVVDRLRWFARFEGKPGAAAVRLPSLTYLARMNDAEVEKLLRVFHVLRPGLNLQKRMLRWIEEIALRESLPTSRVVEWVYSLVEGDGEERARGQLLGQVMEALRKRRFPRIASVREELDRLAAGMKEVSLCLPDEGESERVSLHLELASLAEAERVVETLRGMLGKKSSGAM